MIINEKHIPIINSFGWKYQIAELFNTDNSQTSLGLFALAMVPITDILDKWKSCDYIYVPTLGISQLYNKFTHIDLYIHLFKSIKEYGFKCPLTVTYNKNEFIHDNGHHRLAIAYMLGYDFIPYLLSFEPETTDIDRFIGENMWNTTSPKSLHCLKSIYSEQKTDAEWRPLHDLTVENFIKLAEVNA